MAEESVFFLAVKEICQRDVATCSPDDLLVHAASRMRERNISSLVVCEANEPVGIFTDRDLRNKVVAEGKDPTTIEVRSIMNAPLVTVDEEDFLFEALHAMSSRGIHRVGVIDADGRLTGILTNSDILRLQVQSPQKMLREIEVADTIEELKRLHAQIQGLVVHLVGTRVATSDLVRLIAHLNDRLQVRLVNLLREQRFPHLTERFAFVVLGSEGRSEQTLTTDQDNAIVYDDELGREQVRQVEDFSRSLIEALIQIGVPPCPGGIMAKNDFWRRSLTGWKDVIDDWLSTPTPENILNGSMFFDIRTLHGDPAFEQSLKAHIKDHLAGEDVFLARTAANVLGFKPPLGWFGGIKTEKKGEHRGELDIKKAGIFAMTEGTKVLALEAGFLGGGTRERLDKLHELEVLKAEQTQNLKACYDFLVYLRLRGQVRAVQGGREPSNYLDLAQLNRMERGRLKLALEEVKSFQGFLEHHFKVNLLRS